MAYYVEEPSDSTIVPYRGADEVVPYSDDWRGAFDLAREFYVRARNNPEFLGRSYKAAKPVQGLFESNRSYNSRLQRFNAQVHHIDQKVKPNRVQMPPKALPKPPQKKAATQKGNKPPVASGQIKKSGATVTVGGGGGRVPRQMRLSDDMLMVTLRSTPSLTTATTTGILADSWILGRDGVTANCLEGILGKLATFAGMYDWMRFEELSFEFLPNVAYDATGYIGMAIDPDPRATNPSAITDVSRHTHSVVGDIKQPLTLRVTRRGLNELGSGNLSWYTCNTSADVEWRSPGTLQVYLATNQTAGATVVGQLNIYARVAFKGVNET